MSHVSTYEKAVAALDASRDTISKSVACLRHGGPDAHLAAADALEEVTKALAGISEALKAHAPTIQIRAPFGPTRLK